MDEEGKNLEVKTTVNMEGKARTTATAKTKRDTRGKAESRKKNET